MKKTLLMLLTVLFLAPMLSGCFYYYRDDWNGRGRWEDRGGHDHGRGYDDRRDGYRDDGGRR